MNARVPPLQSFPRRDALVRLEFLAKQIPYTAHVSRAVIAQWCDYVSGFKLSGAIFESADDEQLNNWHERLTIEFAMPRAPIWRSGRHVIRRRFSLLPPGGIR